MMPTEPLNLQLQPHFLVGLAFLALAIFFRFWAISGARQWNNATGVTRRSFENTDPAVNVALRGCFGGVQWLIFMVLCIFCFLAGLDFILFEGDTVVGAVSQGYDLVLANLNGT
ncbi:MAG: hypothetical protein GY759_20175 [Chloroflexi bacterium]|nr:hypothetical protein [Chloroflexota bacterium]